MRVPLSDVDFWNFNRACIETRPVRVSLKPNSTTLNKDGMPFGVRKARQGSAWYEVESHRLGPGLT